jgi:hypothetical protein
MRSAGGKVGGHRVYAAAIEDGGRVAVAVPDASKPKPGTTGGIRAEVAALLRRSPARTRERARIVVGEFTERLLATAPVSVLVTADATPEMRKLATVAGTRGVNVAELVDSGSAALSYEVGAGDGGAARDAVAELVELAESSVDRIATVTVEALGTNIDRGAFANSQRQKQLTEAIVKAMPSIDPHMVAAAAAATASG